MVVDQDTLKVIQSKIPLILEKIHGYSLKNSEIELDDEFYFEIIQILPDGYAIGVNFPNGVCFNLSIHQIWEDVEYIRDEFFFETIEKMIAALEKNIQGKEEEW